MEATQCKTHRFYIIKTTITYRCMNRKEGKGRVGLLHNNTRVLRIDWQPIVWPASRLSEASWIPFEQNGVLAKTAGQLILNSLVPCLQWSGNESEMTVTRRITIIVRPSILGILWDSKSDREVVIGWHWNFWYQKLMGQFQYSVIIRLLPTTLFQFLVSSAYIRGSICHVGR